MNKAINILCVTVLAGILIKLSYVFVHLFAVLDGGGLLAAITGVTFALASVYFVIRIEKRWLKIVIVALDIATILYYYLHDFFRIDIAWASLIVSAYSGLIVYYLGAEIRTITDCRGVPACTTNATTETPEKSARKTRKKNVVETLAVAHKVINQPILF
jgi:hypothetical protein